MSKYNWTQIKSEYIEGVKNKKGDIEYPTLKELSEKYKCSYLYIRGVAAKENWTQERNIYITKIQQLKQEKKSEILASEAARFDSKTLELAKAGENFISVFFNQIVKKFKSEELIKKEDIEGLDRALVNYQKVGKLALGESTDINETKGLEDLDKKLTLLTINELKKISKANETK